MTQNNHKIKYMEDFIKGLQNEEAIKNNRIKELDDIISQEKGNRKQDQKKKKKIRQN